jgi:hypothetical protein
MDDARTAMTKVQATWGTYIPAQLLKYKAEDIFVFCDADKYRNYFSMIYEILFKKAGNYQEASLDFFKDPRGIDSFRAVCGIPAFASPHPHSRRMLYISPNHWVVEKILAHEYIHWLSHEKFYPEYYKVGGQNPFRVEGITQWVTCSTGYDNLDRAYEANLLQTDSWVRADRGNLDRMLKFMFQGTSTNLDAIHP